MFEHFACVMSFNHETTVIDIGVTPDEELADSNFFEAMYPYTSQLTATSIEDCAHLTRRFPGLTFAQTDGSTLPFEDRAFDIAFSSAVLEHVGDHDAQRRFLQEMTRVSKRFYLTTPNRKFPLDLHTFLPVIHWLPRAQHQQILRMLGKDFWASTDNLNLITAGQLRAFMPADSVVVIDGHRTAGVVSNLIAYGESSVVDLSDRRTSRMPGERQNTYS